MSKWVPRVSIALLLAILAALATTGCLFRKKKLAAAPKLPAAPVRIVLLPANTPADNQELHWVSLATTVLMAKHSEDAQDLEVLPFWETLPIALETLGASRAISGETPAYVASRLNAKWATQVDLTPSKNGVSLLVDFMPVKSSMIAYRYEKQTSIDSLHAALREAMEQFLRYLQVRPLAKSGKGIKLVDARELRAISEALDREYGWFSQADPGKAEKTFAGLARTDNRLARLLFRPPASSEPSSKPASASPGSTTAPAAALTPPGPANSSHPGTEPKAQAPAAAPSPTASSARVSSAPSAGTPKTEEPPAARAMRESSRTKTYYIQLNSTLSKAEAEAQAEKIAKAGFRPEVVQVDQKTRGILYQILLQGFVSRKAAKEVARKLVSDGVITEYRILP